MIVDPVAGLLAVLTGDADVTNLVGSRLYGVRLPDDEAAGQPRKALVIAYGGGATPSYASGSAPFNAFRVDLRCYGETHYEADRVLRTAGDVMRRLGRGVHSDAVLHWAQPAGGPQPLFDAQTDWPVMVRSYQVFADERSVT